MNQMPVFLVEGGDVWIKQYNIIIQYTPEHYPRGLERPHTNILARKQLLVKKLKWLVPRKKKVTLAFGGQIHQKCTYKAIYKNKQTNVRVHTKNIYQKK